jgi:GT2 family glycosyltransferase/glycosyltransferase involved in cell wall biosynthesis
MPTLVRFLRALPLLILSPILLGVAMLAAACTDLLFVLAGRKRPDATGPVNRRAATVVIPNWNGRDLLEKYLPSIETALAANPDNEILVVDNGSTDGSAGFLGRAFPRVKVIALPQNLGFGGGSNAGFQAAANDIVVLLNSDMRVDSGFLQPLLDGFVDDKVFAVSCQIFFSDPGKKREETGLTQAWWQDGALRVRHRQDDGIKDLYPCFYGGGGSCAFDRRKFLELGGFDHLLKPFYLEDTDLGYLAWKRGWKVFYQPRSIVFHEHRGTIGKHFSQAHIQGVLKKNFLLFTWKNMHDWRRLLPHFFFTWAGAAISVIFGDEPGRPNFTGLWRACLQLPGAVRSRWRARSLAVIDDSETLRRPLGGYFRDRFHDFTPDPERLSVVFVSPYYILPPAHGGAVFMSQTLRHLARMCAVHVIAILDHHDQIMDNQTLGDYCASTEFLVRMPGASGVAFSILPHAVTEYSNEDMAWLIHRQLYTRRADVLQIEYTNMGQYLGDFRNIVTALFEHDIYFQSIGRSLEHMPGAVNRVKARFEYLRAIRYELRMLHRPDSIQVCTEENRKHLASFLPARSEDILPGLRAGIDTARYEFRSEGREPRTMLFLGSFRHMPNQVALDWFTGKVMPEILAVEPAAKLIVVGSDPPPVHAYGDLAANLELKGFVEDAQAVIDRSAVFICPILSGSGVRVKLLEAFASGIPVVSTKIGAEGLAGKDGEFCLLADDPKDFAAKVVHVLRHPEEAREMARRARAHVVEHWDMAVITAKLENSYRVKLQCKRKQTNGRGESLW